MHLAVPGQHAALHNALEMRETVLPPDAESHSTMSSIRLMDAPVLVFEVARTAVSTQRIEYGVTENARTARIFMDVDNEEYTLVGVVCRAGSHYVGVVWVQDTGWGVYDDTQHDGAILAISHPENTPAPPSRFGELFFYVQTDQ